jgi:VCBS repeat-containing protein
MVAAMLVPVADAPAAASPPMLTATPTSTSAAPLVMTAGGQPQTITVINRERSKATSALAVTLSEDPSTAGFSISSDLCSGVALGPSKSCTVTVAYPGSTAPPTEETATLTVASKKARASVSSYFEIAAAPSNHAPVANPDAFSIDEDQAFGSPNNTSVLGNLLANDVDPDGDTIVVSACGSASLDASAAPAFAAATVVATDTDPSDGDGCEYAISLNGTSSVVSISSDGTVTLSDPNHLFDPLGSGQQLVLQIGYTVSDGHGGTSSSTISITVTGVNDAPTDNG